MTPSTKQALAASLKKLLKRKYLDDITVKEIVADCAVNRQTFYYHFQDIYDLLRFLLAEETQEVLADSGGWQDALLRAFQYIQTERTVVYHVFLSDGREHLDCQMYALARSIVEEELGRCAGDLPLVEGDRSFLVEFYMHALAGMMIAWMARDMKEEPEDLVAQTARLMEGELRRGAEKFSRSGALR